MKVYAIQSKNGIIMKVVVNADNKVIEVLVKIIIGGIQACVIFRCNKGWIIDEYLNIKNSSSEKHLIGKLVLECENKILYYWNLNYI